MKFIKQFFTLAILLGFGIGSVIFISETIKTNLNFGQADALFGGELEKGYPSAGFVVSFTPNGIKTCGYSIINSRMAITASHCVDDSTEIYLGLGDFNADRSANVRVVRAIQKQGWVGGKQRSDDFAILIVNETPGFFTQFATVTSPVEGCNMRVVAYGRTEDPAESATKPRKSAVMCASQINNSTFVVKARDSLAGICFGDSGSPIYINNTENVVGVVASIILENPNDPSPCAFGNSAIVVRADSNANLINQELNQISSGTLPNTVEVADGLTITVANETIFDKLGLTSLDAQTRNTYILYGTVGSIVFLIIVMLLVILKPAGQKKDVTYVQEGWG